MVRSILAAAVLVSWLPAAGGGQALTGIVVDSVSGYPLEGVLVSIPEAGLRTETRPNGSFVLEGLTSGEHVVLVSTWGFATVGVRLQVTIDDHRGASIGVIRMSPAATVTGVVLDSATGLPLLGVDVRIPALRLSAETDTQGAFALEGVPGGSHVVEFRRLGYLASAVEATLTVSTPSELSLGSVSLAATALLPALEVLGAEVESSIMPDFEHLQRTGQGRYLTAVDIEKLNPRNTSDVIRHLAGFTSSADDGIGIEAGKVRGGRAGNCVTRFYVDGIRSSATSLDMIQPRTLAGIEVYSGPASIPAMYQSPNQPVCGLIIFWTKDASNRSRGQ